SYSLDLSKPVPDRIVDPEFWYVKADVVSQHGESGRAIVRHQALSLERPAFTDRHIPSSTKRAMARNSKFQTRFCDGGEHGMFRSSTTRAMARNSKFQTRFCDDGANTSSKNCPGSCVSMSRQSAIARRLRAWGKAHSFHLGASHKLQCFTKLLGGRQPPVVVPPRIFSEIEIEMVSADGALGVVADL